jgi:VanZ family protein
MHKQRGELSRSLTAWLPVALWAALIFFFSTDAGSLLNTGGLLARLLSALYSDFTADQIDSIHFIVRKLGHWTEYFIFALLILRALRTPSQPGPGPKPRHILLTLAIVVAAAVSDELHQTLIPSRTGSPIDVMIDAFGGVCGVLWTRCFAIHSYRAYGDLQKS